MKKISFFLLLSFVAIATYLSIPLVLNCIWHARIQRVSDNWGYWEQVAFGRNLELALDDVTGYGVTGQGYDCKFSFRCDPESMVQNLRELEFKQGTYAEFGHPFSEAREYDAKLPSDWVDSFNEFSTVYYKRFADYSITLVMLNSNKVYVYSKGASSPNR